MAEHVLQPTHAKALVEYVGFLRRKREGCVAEVAAEFKELREMRLFEDNYTKDDVESLLSGLLAVVRTTLKKDLQATMHSSVLILKQQFEQGEKAGVPLEIDLPATENRCHAARRAPRTCRVLPLPPRRPLPLAPRAVRRRPDPQGPAQGRGRVGDEPGGRQDGAPAQSARHQR